MCGGGGGGPGGEFGSIGIALKAKPHWQPRQRCTGSPHRDGVAYRLLRHLPHPLGNLQRLCVWVDEPEREAAVDRRAQISRTLVLRVDHGSLS